MKLFVGRLSTDTTEQELRDAFSSYEPVLEVHRPLDRETGRPRGFAFVTLDSRETGEAAIKELDGQELGGRNICVNEAEDRRTTNHRPTIRPYREPDTDPTSTASRPVDDRPVGKDGKKVRYKSI